MDITIKYTCMGIEWSGQDPYSLQQCNNKLNFNPYSTATNNIGQKYNGLEYRYQ